MRRTPPRILSFLLVVAGFAASCGSSSGTPDAGPEGGGDGTAPPKKDSGTHDGGPRDGHAGDSRPGDASSGDANPDANPGDSTPGDGPVTDSGFACHKIEGDGSTLACTSPTGPTAPAICDGTGYVPGPCPSAGLTGCCIFSSGNAICSYASDSTPVSTEKSTCLSGGGTWTTTAP